MRVGPYILVSSQRTLQPNIILSKKKNTLTISRPQNRTKLQRNLLPTPPHTTFILENFVKKFQWLENNFESVQTYRRPYLSQPYLHIMHTVLCLPFSSQGFEECRLEGLLVSSRNGGRKGMQSA